MAEQLTIQCPVCGFENPIEEDDRGGQIFCASHGGPIDIPAGSPAAADRMIGSYRLIEKLGEGGMGAVWKALHTKLDKHVAIKLLPQHLTNSPAVVSRFEREMKAVGRLEHPHIVRAMDAGDDQGTLYLVMECIEGTDLAKLVKSRGPRSVADSCEMIRQASLGLSHAHQNGLVHRDIKPSNLFLTKQGKIKILDLGLARLRSDAPNAVESGEITGLGQILGTPDYMAPEQWENTHTVDLRTDLYSLGCTLFFLLAGRAPFADGKHNTLVKKMAGHTTEDIPDLQAARQTAIEQKPKLATDAIPEALVEVYKKLMARRPEERFASADDLAKRLLEISDGTGAVASPTPVAEPSDVNGNARAMEVVSADPTRRASPAIPVGSGLWCVEAKPRTGGALALRNCPISDGRGRMVAALQDVVVCLAEEGAGVRVVWEYPTGGFISGSPAAAADGTLRVHSNDGRLHGLSPDGQPLWPPVDVGESLNWSSPLVDPEGTTWLCGYSGGLIKVDASGKKSPRPYFRSPNKFDCAGVLHGGMCVVGSEDQFVHAIDLRGERGSDVWDQGANRGRTNWFINSAIALASGPTFVVASRDEFLYGFAPDGSEVWQTKVPGQVLGSPVVDADDRVFIGVCRGDRGSTPQGALACFDIRRRQWLWEVSAQGPVESTPVVGSDGTVYFGDNAGFVQAVSASGKSLWQVCVGQPVRSAGTIVSSGHVVFGDDAGRLFALHCDSTGLANGWPKSLGAAAWAAPPAASDASGRAADETRTSIRIPFDCSSATPPSQDSKSVRPESQPVPRPPVVEQLPRPPVPPQSTAKETVTATPTPTPKVAGDRMASELPSRPVSEAAGVRETVGVKQAVGVRGVSADGLPTGVTTTSRELPAVEQSVITTSPTTSSSPTFSQPLVVEVLPPPTAAPQPLAGRLISVVDYGTGTDRLHTRHYPWRLPRTGQAEQRVLYLTNGGPGDLFVTVQCAGRGVAASPAGRLRIPPGRQKFVVLNIESTADEWLLVNFQTPDSRLGKRLTVRIQR